MEHVSTTHTATAPAPAAGRRHRPAAEPAAVAHRLPTRVALLTGGAASISAVIAVLVWNDLGPGPIDTFIVGVHTHTGLPISVSIWLLFGLINVVAWSLGHRPGIGTLLAPLVGGFVIEAALAILVDFERPDALAVRVGVQVVGIAVAGIGVGAMVASKLGAGPPELLATALADRTGVPESVARTAFELSCLGGALLLGGPVGLGTVIVAALIGPAVVRGCRIVDAALAAERGRRRQYHRGRGRATPSDVGTPTDRRGGEHPGYEKEPRHDDRREPTRCRDAAGSRHQRRFPHHRATRLLHRAHRPCVP